LKRRKVERRCKSLISCEDAPSVDDVFQRDLVVLPPCADDLGGLDEDQEVVAGAGVVHAGLVAVGAHFDL
jgi:hypothetical protein